MPRVRRRRGPNVKLLMMRRSGRIDQIGAAPPPVRCDFANLARIRAGIARPEACFATGGVLAESEGPRRGANSPTTAPLRLIRRRGVKRERARVVFAQMPRVALSFSLGITQETLSLSLSLAFPGVVVQSAIFIVWSIQSLCLLSAASSPC
jgi:hypothetical protein